MTTEDQHPFLSHVQLDDEDGHDSEKEEPLVQYAAPPLGVVFPQTQQLSYMSQLHSDVHMLAQQSTTTTTTTALPTLPTRPDGRLGMAIFACLCCFWPTGILAIGYACQVSDLYNAGNYEGAQRASVNSYRCSKISIVIGGILLVINILLCTVIILTLPSSSAL